MQYGLTDSQHGLDTHNYSTNNKEVTLSDLDKFILSCKEISDRYCDACKFPRRVFGYDNNKTYYRVWIADNEQGHSKSVHCFVNKLTGDVYKGSWKAPVNNGKRGNFYEPDIGRFIGHYGPHYLR